MGPYAKGENGEIKVDENGSTNFSIPELIIKKREGYKLSEEEISWFVDHLVAGKVQDGQLGPFSKYNIERYQDSVYNLYKTYGKIAKETIAGSTILHLFDPDDIRTVFTTEGKMPYVAPLMETTQLYRHQRGLALGLGNTNGEEWYRLRSAVQQMMMRPKAVTVYLPFVNSVAEDFISRLKTVCNQQGKVENLKNEIAKWNVESAAMTVFEKRLHCMNDGPNSEVQKMVDANDAMFTLSAKMKFQLPLYKVIRTPTWSKLVAAEECVVRTSQRYLDRALADMSKLMKEGQLEEGRFNFLSYLISRKELDQRDISIVVLSLFGDGLSTTHVELNNFVMFQDPQYFDDPSEFRPERWLRDGSAQFIHPYILTPFGHGPRMCAGRRFAEQEMFVVITKVLQNFRLEWNNKKDLRQKYQILMVPDAPVDITFLAR